MNAGLADKTRWLAAAGGALAGVAALLAFMQMLRLPEVQPAVAAAVGLKSVALHSRVADDDMSIHDQTPLFLPTERNVALKRLARPETGAPLFDQDVVKPTFGEAELALRLPAPVALAEKPAEAVLADAAAIPLFGLGRVAVAIEPLPARGARIEIFRADTNRPVLAESLPVSARPPFEKSWRPMEFLAEVGPAGLRSSLVLTERSDAEEVENYFRVYLARSFRVGERLPAGIYRVAVGP